MPTDALRVTVARVRDALARAEPTDGQLLNRFVATRDGAAFAALVARHGRMVFGVCRRVLGDYHLAEDAFQATFVVLARRAGAVHPPEAVGNFLYGVAHRTALEARGVARRKATRERTVAELPDRPVIENHSNDWSGVLDAELVRMPAKYRELLVACDLQERPRREVAAAFGLVEGTLSSRLTAARQMLADRLRKRGVLLAVPAVMAAAREVGAEVPPGVLTTARIGWAVRTGAVPAAAALLTRAVRVMTTPKFTIPAAILVAVAVGLWAASGPASDSQAPPPPTPRPVAAQPVKAAQREPQMLVWRRGYPILLGSDGKELKELPNGTFADKVGGGLLSPDGKQVAYSVEAEIVRQSPRHIGLYREKVYLRDLDDTETGTDLNIDGQLHLWSRDGRRLYGITHDWDKIREGNGFGESITWVYDLATKAKSVLALPNDFYVTDESPDGKHLLAHKVFMEDNVPKTQTYLTSLDGKTRTVILDTDCEYRGMKFSPDGSKVLLANHSMKNLAPEKEQKFAIYDVATKTVTPLKIEGLPKFHWVTCDAYAWHPDGKRIYFVWHELPDPALTPKGILPGIPAPGAKQPPPIVEPPVDPKNPPQVVPAGQPGRYPENISIVNADGSGMKVIYTEKKHRIDRINWR